MRRLFADRLVLITALAVILGALAFGALRALV